MSSISFKNSKVVILIIVCGILSGCGPYYLKPAYFPIHSGYINSPEYEETSLMPITMPKLILKELMFIEMVLYF